jgi:hypothetical protein
LLPFSNQGDEDHYVLSPLLHSAYWCNHSNGKEQVMEFSAWILHCSEMEKWNCITNTALSENRYIWQIILYAQVHNFYLQCSMQVIMMNLQLHFQIKVLMVTLS